MPGSGLRLAALALAILLSGASARSMHGLSGADARTSRSLLQSCPNNCAIPTPDNCAGNTDTYGYACTGSPGFWKNNGQCVWPVNSLVVGTVSYTKTQLLATLNLATSGTSCYGPVSNDFMNLIRQFIAAALSVENFRKGGFISQVPATVISALATANQTIGDRLLPIACPVVSPNNGLCGCCATSNCGSGSVCAAANQGCNQLTGLSTVTSTLGTWAAGNECAVNA
ncbi:hypothetical protein ABPG75_010307 [Micractinium tetrahymenae]